MRNVWLIMRREYLERVRSKSFIITTVLLPLFMFGSMVLPSTLMMMKTGKAKRLAVVVSDEEFGKSLQRALMSPGRDIGSGYEVTLSTDTSPQAEERLRAQINANTIDGYLWATREDLDKGSVTHGTRDAADFVENASLSSAVTKAAVEQRLVDRGIPRDQVAGALARVKVDSVRLRPTGDVRQSGPAVYLATLIMVMMLYVTLLIYGQGVMRAVLEEKSTRIVEVVLSSATSMQLMAGKILGVGAAGLTQVTLWAAAAAAMLALPAMASAPGLKEVFSTATLLYFPVFFVLGYLLYSAMYAAVGAMVNSEQEAQNVQFFVMLPILAAIMLMFFVMRQPASGTSVVLSMVPFFAPLLMFMRIVVQTPPLWQIAACIALMTVTTWGVMLVCARIYRVGVLMYGKRATLPEIVKWLRYA